MTQYIFFTTEYLDFVHHMELEVILCIFYIKFYSNLIIFLKNYVIQKIGMEMKQTTLRSTTFMYTFFKYNLNTVCM